MKRLEWRDMWMNFYTALIVFIFFSVEARAQNVSVFTQRYNNSRIGWNDHEVLLNSSNINSTDFGFLFARQVDDQMYAQPLLVSNLTIGSTTQNVVFVATVNNSLYAFNADDPLLGDPLWHVNLTPAGARVIKNTDMTGACGGNYYEFTGNIGIVSTPVIDIPNSTIYVVSRDITSSNKFEQFIHAIDIRTGAEKPGSPVFITAKVAGNGIGSVNDTIVFDQQKENQRSALLLLNGVVYVSWASHCDWDPYHGWLIGFDAVTLQKKYVYNDTPDGREGGIWMSGTGPCADENGNIYLITGNGTVGKAGNPNDLRNRGESFLKMIPFGNSFTIVDFFTPADFQNLEDNDLDYGTDGPLLIPRTNLSISGTKQGILYLLNDNSMGRYSPGNDSVIQILYTTSHPEGSSHAVFGTPVYYSSDDSEYVYIWGANDSLMQFLFDRNAGRFDFSKTIRGTHPVSFSLPGALLSVSSNGTTPGTGILWASHPQVGDAGNTTLPGSLDAYDARDVRRLLWSSDEGPESNRVGNFAKFNSPIIANGKVYEPTFSNKLIVYGLHSEVFLPEVKKKEISELMLLPNPAHEFIDLQYTLNTNENLVFLTVTDVSGRVIFVKNLNGIQGIHSERIEIGNQLKPGIYIISLRSDKNVHLNAELLTY